MLPPDVHIAAADGEAAATTGQPITACPHAAQRTPQERALARAWVRGYLDRRPPAAGVVDYDGADEPDTPGDSAAVARAGEAEDTATTADADLDRAELDQLAREMRERLGALPDVEPEGRNAVTATRKELAIPSATRLKQMGRDRDRDVRDRSYAANSVLSETQRVAELQAALTSGRRQVAEVKAALARGGLRPAVRDRLVRLAVNGDESITRTLDSIENVERDLATARDRWLSIREE